MSLILRYAQQHKYFDDLTEARRLIKQWGYGRRSEELEDAEKAIVEYLNRKRNLIHLPQLKKQFCYSVR